MSQDEDRHRAELAQAIRRAKENLPAIMEFTVLAAQEAKMKYDAFIKAGFTEEQALRLLMANLGGRV